jgi:hypothetical protein
MTSLSSSIGSSEEPPASLELVFYDECDASHTMCMTNSAIHDISDLLDHEGNDNCVHLAHRAAQVCMAEDTGVPGSGPRPVVHSPKDIAKARAVIRDGTTMPENLMREELLAYHYIMKTTHEQLEETRMALEERRRLTDESSMWRAQLSSTHNSSTCTPTPRQQRYRYRVNLMPENSRRETSKSLDSTFMTVDTTGNVFPKTPEAAILAATTYLQSILPPA